jgi:hypothetical protein
MEVVLCKVSVKQEEEYRLSVFENWALRRTSGPKGDEVKGDWRKLHNEDLHNYCSSPNVIRMIKSRRMRWAGHVARMGEKRDDNDNDKPIKSLLKGKGLLPPIGLARLDS